MLKLENVSVIYDNKVLAVDDVSLEVEQGEFIGVIGSSGSGKSTLLKTINLLVRPASGKVILGDRDITSLGKKELRLIRREIGFVFQDYNLIDRSTVIENVLIGRLGYKSSFKSILGMFSEDDYERAARALRQVGLEDKMFQRADNLSGGQMQRVAIAKTLCQRPKIILADEPVASLDVASSQTIMEYFKKVNEKKNMTIMINLHDVNLAKKYCDRIIALKKGKLVFDGEEGEIDDALLRKIYEE